MPNIIIGLLSLPNINSGQIRCLDQYDVCTNIIRGQISLCLILL